MLLKAYLFNLNYNDILECIIEIIVDICKNKTKITQSNRKPLFANTLNNFQGNMFSSKVFFCMTIVYVVYNDILLHNLRPHVVSLSPVWGRKELIMLRKY